MLPFIIGGAVLFGLYKAATSDDDSSSSSSSYDYEAEAKREREAKLTRERNRIKKGLADKLDQAQRHLENITSSTDYKHSLDMSEVRAFCASESSSESFLGSPAGTSLNSYSSQFIASVFQTDLKSSHTATSYIWKHRIQRIGFSKDSKALLEYLQKMASLRNIPDLPCALEFNQALTDIARIKDEIKMLEHMRLQIAQENTAT